MSHLMKTHIGMIASLNYTRSLPYMSPVRCLDSEIREASSSLHATACTSEKLLRRSAPMSSSVGRINHTAFPPVLLMDGYHARASIEMSACRSESSSVVISNESSTNIHHPESTSASQHTIKSRDKIEWHRTQLNKTPGKRVDYPSMILGAELIDKSCSKLVSAVLVPPSLPPRAMRISQATTLSDATSQWKVGSVRRCSATSTYTPPLVWPSPQSNFSLYPLILSSLSSPHLHPLLIPILIFIRILSFISPSPYLYHSLSLFISSTHYLLPVCRRYLWCLRRDSLFQRILCSNQWNALETLSHSMLP